eukprot:s474_g11.t1
MWASPYSLEELAGLLLAPLKCKLKLNSSAYLVASQQDLKDFPVHETELTRSEKKHRLLLGWEQLHILGYPTWGPGSMPPFDDEPAEKNPKPLSFLKLSHAPASAKRRAPQHRVFGDEPSEPVDAGRGVGCRARANTAPSTNPVRKRPFGDEDDEGSSKLSCSKSSCPPLFGDEVSEDDASPQKTKVATKPFADETSEGNTSSQSSSEEKFEVKRDTVFAFGWGSVATFKKATVWRENMDDPKSSKPKRNYDNSKRAKDAQYLRERTKGFYKRNGLDPARLQKLFDANTCLCTVMDLYEHYKRINNHNGKVATDLRKLANAVSFSYGHRYQKSIDYLESLAANRFWHSATLAPLPWHSTPAHAAPPGPQLAIHQAVLNALAPSVPLRAVFSRQ